MLAPKQPLFFFPCGLGWWMHLGVKVTELSTNKQHHLFGSSLEGGLVVSLNLSSMSSIHPSLLPLPVLSSSRSHFPPLLATEDTVSHLLKRGEHEETWNTRVSEFCCVLPRLFALFVGQGSAARIVRSGIWWNLGLLYYYWAVFTFLKRWVYIDLDRMSFFKRCVITSFENGLCVCLLLQDLW